nr:probable phytol kinase 1, chloroplastic [Ipomoea trifida]
MQTGFLTATPAGAGAVLLHSGIRRRCHIGSSNFPLPLTIPKLQLQPLRTSRGSVSSAAAFDVMRDYGSAAFQDAGAMALTIAGAYALVSTFDGLTQRNLIPQSLSRKLVHILSGLLFMASWPIFRLLVNGLRFADDEGLVKSVTREGNPEELLRGPLYYVMVLILCALVFWRESPVGVVSLAMMCGGDGVADIIGRRFGSVKIPYNQQKSWAGSISMFVFGFLISLGMLCYFSALGYFHLDWIPTIERVAVVSLVATVVESLPTNGAVDDNISVPLVSMITASLSFGL